MSEAQGKADKRGTIKDWPAELAAACLVLLVLTIGGSDSAAGALRVVLAIGAAFGVVTWLVRAGAFSPRRD